MSGPDSVKKVLIVEWNEFNTRLINDLLEAHGIIVMKAYRADSALALAKEHSFDLVITDVEMPDMSAADICGALRRDERTKALPILVLTHQNGKGWSKESLLEAGATGFISKPLSVSPFLETVHELLG